MVLRAGLGIKYIPIFSKFKNSDDLLNKHTVVCSAFLYIKLQGANWKKYLFCESVFLRV